MSQSLNAMMIQQKGFQQEKTMTVRFPSTSAFMIDSVNREDVSLTASSGDFSIVKPMSLNNGFFTRMALQEIVLDFGIPNISSVHGNDTFYLTYNIGAGNLNTSVVLPPGWYTVKEALDTLVTQLNASIGVGIFQIVSGQGQTSLDMVNPAHTFSIPSVGPGPVPNDLGAELFAENQLDTTPRNFFYLIAPRLLPFRYLDFVCNQLTYNQKLKDNDTSLQSRDVLYRWYFAWDDVTTYDAYDFPILQGYRPFTQRRLISFPKQIQWTPNMPVGNLNFQVYNDTDEIVDATQYPSTEGGAEMEFQMTLLLSED